MGRQKEIVLMMFSKNDSEQAILATGREVVDGKILENDGKESKCRICGKTMTVENVGRILPGSIDLYCDEPTCFNDFSVKLV